jgi:hypothetical protein
MRVILVIHICMPPTERFAECGWWRLARRPPGKAYGPSVAVESRRLPRPFWQPGSIARLVAMCASSHMSLAKNAR